MNYARIVAPLAFAAALAACSGSLGGGQSTLPGAPLPNGQQQITQPAPSSTPALANNIASVGDSTVPQPLPTVAGYGGTVSFPKPAPTSTGKPNPKVSPTPDVSGPLAVGITAAIVEPTDAPKFTQTKKRLLGKADANAPKPLFFISLLSTADVSFDAYPKFSIDVPREIITKYRDGSFGLALYDPAEKTKHYRLAVAERDLSTPAPGSARGPASIGTSTLPTPAPSPTMSARPSGPGGLTPPPLPVTPVPAAAPTLPPERIAFDGPAIPLVLKANRAVVFALYAIPAAPSPGPSPSTHPSSAPNAKSIGSPVPSPSGSPNPAASSASSSVTESSSAAPSGSPASSTSAAASPVASPK